MQESQAVFSVYIQILDNFYCLKILITNNVIELLLMSKMIILLFIALIIYTDMASGVNQMCKPLECTIGTTAKVSVFFCCFFFFNFTEEHRIRHLKRLILSSSWRPRNLSLRTSLQIFFLQYLYILLNFSVLFLKFFKVTGFLENDKLSLLSFI